MKPNLASDQTKGSNIAVHGSWRFSLAVGILAAVVFLAAWLPTQEPRPHLPTSDLYTHLTVTRHLARGDGFLTDVTYPLSFAYPFARVLPQPLVHRQPGYSLLLLAPYLGGQGSPATVLERVRWLQVFLLGGIVLAGTVAFVRRRRLSAVAPWLVFLFLNPLLVYAVDWGMVELACSLILLVLWLRVRRDPSPVPCWIDGLLAGFLALLRMDLFWVPALWWIATLRGGRSSQAQPDTTGRGVVARRLGYLFLAWLVVTAPWAVRNARVAGNPLFSLQASAEHVKDTRSWPSYDVYRQLEPQPLLETLTTDPVPVLRKFGRGVKFYFRDLHRLVPGLILAGFASGLLMYAAVLSRLVKARPGRRRWDPLWRIPPLDQTRPMALISMTFLFLIMMYSVFDHSLRHLLVLLPVVLWETAHLVGESVRMIIQNRYDRRGGGSRLQRDLGALIVLPAAAAMAIVLVKPCRTPGWDAAAQDATRLVIATEQAVTNAKEAPPGVLFVASSAVPWFIDRPVVWAPLDDSTRVRIRELLGQGTQTGGMARE